MRPDAPGGAGEKNFHGFNWDLAGRIGAPGKKRHERLVYLALRKQLSPREPFARPNVELKQMRLPTRRPLLYVLGIGAALLTGAGAVHFGLAQTETLRPALAQTAQVTRPLYDLRATLDYELLTLGARAQITVPANAADPLSDAVFFLYANADGVGGADDKRKNLKVESVAVEGAPVKWKLDGAVLRVDLGAPRTAPFVVNIEYKGVVPRSSGGDDDMMGGLMSADISGMLGLPGADDKAAAKPKNTDYGLYTAGRDIVSLGSFWYPTLAVRQNKKWADDAPHGLGDVAFSEKSDYRVSLGVPPEVTVVAPGEVKRGADGRVEIRADNVREVAVLMSDQYLVKSKTVDVAGKPVRVEAFARKESEAKLDQSLDVAARALQIYAKRFGPYNFDSFKVAEAPMKSGAGGMEYSAMTGIASGLYGDMGKQLGGLMTTLNLPGASELLGGLGDDTLGGAAPKNDDNPMAGMLGGILGQQKEMLDTMLETTVAHEVAHQWWAIGVGSDSQKHPFVDESLTNWSAMLYYEDRYGKAKAAQMIEMNLNTSFSMGAMLGGGDRPANLPTAAYANNLQYGAVIYGKGALFYEKLRGLVGDEAFFGALQAYYARFDNKLAGPNDLKALMIQKSPAKKAQIEALYTRWVDEAHGNEDIGGGMLGGLDLGGMLGGILGGGLGGE